LGLCFATPTWALKIIYTYHHDKNSTTLEVEVFDDDWKKLGYYCMTPRPESISEEAIVIPIRTEGIVGTLTSMRLQMN